MAAEADEADKTKPALRFFWINLSQSPSLSINKSISISCLGNSQLTTHN